MDFGRTLNLILFVYFMHWRLGLYKHLHDGWTLEVFEFNVLDFGFLVFWIIGLLLVLIYYLVFDIFDIWWLLIYIF